ncbi:MAG TPA: hypothetical protein VNZ57_08985, partial [Longimicrobiales bacterium]|nr:hypothetical protein [Longimicrobiales bacterium]
ESDAHPLPERRTRWRPRELLEAVDGTGGRLKRSGPRSRRAGGGDGGEGVSPGHDRGRERDRDRDRKRAGRQGSDAAGSRSPPPRPPLTIQPAGDGIAADAIAGMLTLQLLPEPRRIRVETRPRRDYHVPIRYHDGQRWRPIETAAGPDRLSGDRWETPFAREYFRSVDGDGTLVWIYRDGYDGGWYLHGWWD